MCNNLDDLRFGDAGAERLTDMKTQFVSTIERDQTADCHNAALTWGKTWPFPDITEQNMICVVGKAGSDITESLTSG